MGGASSKATRQFPKPKKPLWAGARTPSPGEAPQSAKPTLPRASETRNEDIEQDAKDPQFLANLSRLGPVKVDHHMQTFRLGADNTQHVLQTRLQSEAEARSSHPTHNRLLAASLQELLEERKSVTTQAELEKLAKRYNVDVAKLESVAQFVNSPSVLPGSVVRTVSDDGEERITMLATWADPQHLEGRPLVGSNTKS
ncbi:predicted protein [Sparassis crispa]|uniref:Uncharacterized protein n=1 Tax=Sparassis crispa TaxID=139825 RepID=A0A401GEY4_9APHY|nr:predicted protein [Sparassis crispa]GBE80729.1 predicted protein [Sparassis crispa]